MSTIEEIKNPPSTVAALEGGSGKGGQEMFGGLLLFEPLTDEFVRRPAQEQGFHVASFEVRIRAGVTGVNGNFLKFCFCEASANAICAEEGDTIDSDDNRLNGS